MLKMTVAVTIGSRFGGFVLKAIKISLKEIIPIIPSYVFMGIAVGILFSSYGYGPLWTTLASLFIYAGSMQMVMVSLMASGAPFLTIATMAVFVNGRHVFYGIGMLERFRNRGLKGVYMALFMVDATFSILTGLKDYENVERDDLDFYISLFGHILWVVSCAFGALCGELITFDMTGIEFSATAFFTVIVVNQWISAKSYLPAISGVISAIVFWIVIGADNFMLPALSVSMIVLALMKDKIQAKQMEGVKEND